MNAENIERAGAPIFLLWEMRLGGIEANIEQASDSFLRRHDLRANVCYGHPTRVFEGMTTEVEGIRLGIKSTVRPNTLLIGWEPGGGA